MKAATGELTCLLSTIRRHTYKAGWTSHADLVGVVWPKKGQEASRSEHRLSVLRFCCSVSVINRNNSRVRCALAEELSTFLRFSRCVGRHSLLSGIFVVDILPLSRADGSFPKTTSSPPKSGTFNVPRLAWHVSRREPSATQRLDLLHPHLR